MFTRNCEWRIWTNYWYNKNAKKNNEKPKRKKNKFKEKCYTNKQSADSCENRLFFSYASIENRWCGKYSHFMAGQKRPKILLKKYSIKGTDR